MAYVVDLIVCSKNVEDYARDLSRTYEKFRDNNCMQRLVSALLAKEIDFVERLVMN